MAQFGWFTTWRTCASVLTRTKVWAAAGRPKVLWDEGLCLVRRQGWCMAEFSQTKEKFMPSFDAVLDPNLVEVRNAVDQTTKGKSAPASISKAPVPPSNSRKEKQIIVTGDSDFQLDQVRDILTNKLTKRSVDVRFLDIGKVKRSAATRSSRS